MTRGLSETAGSPLKGNLLGWYARPAIITENAVQEQNPIVLCGEA